MSQELSRENTQHITQFLNRLISSYYGNNGEISVGGVKKATDDEFFEEIEKELAAPADNITQLETADDEMMKEALHTLGTEAEQYSRNDFLEIEMSTSTETPAIETLQKSRAIAQGIGDVMKHFKADTIDANTTIMTPKTSAGDITNIDRQWLLSSIELAEQDFEQAERLFADGCRDVEQQKATEENARKGMEFLEKLLAPHNKKIPSGEESLDDELLSVIPKMNFDAFEPEADAGFKYSGAKIIYDHRIEKRLTDMPGQNDILPVQKIAEALQNIVSKNGEEIPMKYEEATGKTSIEIDNDSLISLAEQVQTRTGEMAARNRFNSALGQGQMRSV